MVKDIQTSCNTSFLSNNSNDEPVKSKIILIMATLLKLHVVCGLILHTGVS